MSTSTAMSDLPEVASTEALAAWLGLAPSTLRAWRHRDIGPRGFVLPGTRRVLYRREDVLAWVDAAHQQQTA